MGLKIHVPLADRGVVSVSGEDAQSFLQGLITNDIEKVSKTTAIYAALLTPQGKFLHDFFIVEHKDRYLLDCDVSRIPDLIKRLSMYRLRAKVDIADESAKFSVGIMLEPDGAASTGEAGAAKTRFDGVSYIDPRHAGLGERTIRLIDDSYNANPESMSAALKTLGHMQPDGGRRVAIIGDMLELGDTSRTAHAGLKDHIEKNDIDAVFMAGPEMSALADVLDADRIGATADSAAALLPAVAAYRTDVARWLG